MTTTEHQHERWQVHDDGNGYYCRACGKHMSAVDMALMRAGEGKPSWRDGPEADQAFVDRSVLADELRRTRLALAEVTSPGSTVNVALDGGPDLSDTDPTLLWLLRRAGEEWGPLGVLRVAAKLQAHA